MNILNYFKDKREKEYQKNLNLRKEMWLQWATSKKENDDDILVPNECMPLKNNELWNAIKDGQSFKLFKDFENCNMVYIVNKNKI